MSLCNPVVAAAAHNIPVPAAEMHTSRAPHTISHRLPPHRTVHLQVDEFYGALLEGRSGVSQIEGFDAGDFSTRIAGEIKHFTGDGYIDKRSERRLDSFLKYAIVAGKKVRDPCGKPSLLCALSGHACGSYVVSVHTLRMPRRCHADRLR